MRSYIIFKNMNSEVMRTRITKLPPLIRAPERVSPQQIPGRHGALTLLEGSKPTYDTFKQDIEGVMLPGADRNAVMEWLSLSGDLILSTDMTKRQIARVVEAVSFERIVTGRPHRSFTATFECQPFRYEAEPSTVQYTSPVSVGNPNVIFNPGTVESEPEITVTGSGDIMLTINEADITLTNISGQIIIDTEMGDAYDGDILLNNYMYGDFPFLWPGKNTITWTGSVSKVVIKPRWRWK